MKPINNVNAVLDMLAEQKQRGETSLVVTIEPALIPQAMDALRSYKKLFAPVIAGQTDTAPIHEGYERMRAAYPDLHTILLLVECQTVEQFREALEPLPMRNSSDWKVFSSTEPTGPF
jgi:hypothetical protein